MWGTNFTRNVFMEQTEMQSANIKNFTSDTPLIPRSEWTWKSKLQSSLYMYPQLSSLIVLLDRHYHHITSKLAAKFPELEIYQWEYFVLDFSKQLYGKIISSPKKPTSTLGISQQMAQTLHGIAVSNAPYSFAGGVTTTNNFLNTNTVMDAGIPFGPISDNILSINNTANWCPAANQFNFNRSEDKQETVTTHQPLVTEIVEEVKKKFFFKDSVKLTEYMNIELNIPENEAIEFWEKIYELLKFTSPQKS